MAGTHGIDGMVVHADGVVEIAISDRTSYRVDRGTIEVSVGYLRSLSEFAAAAYDAEFGDEYGLLAEAEEKWERYARYE